MQGVRAIILKILCTDPSPARNIATQKIVPTWYISHPLLTRLGTLVAETNKVNPTHICFMQGEPKLYAVMDYH